MNTDAAKDAVRARVWASLDEARVVRPPGARGRIPDFHGSHEAARLLRALPAWQNSRVVKSNPDGAQHPVRTAALEDGKLVYMAVPRLATPEPFYLLDPADQAAPADEAATSDHAATHAPKVNLGQMRPVDLVVCGSVAVNRSGVRLGKGAGYSDIEVALLTEVGLVGPDTVYVTTVHALQVLDEDLPETEHDFSVDLIITPHEVIHCGNPRRPNGLYWDHLSPDKIAAIPALQAASTDPL